jgi:hypothetical protein
MFQQVGGCYREADRATCLGCIGQRWIDIRPKSLRERLAENRGFGALARLSGPKLALADQIEDRTMTGDYGQSLGVPASVLKVRDGWLDAL